MWELRGHGSAGPGPGGDAGELPPWFAVGLVYADGARIDVLAQMSGGRLLIEDMRADPPLPVDGFGTLTERIGQPLRDVCRAIGGPHGALAEETRPEAADAGEVADGTADAEPADPPAPEEAAPAAGPGARHRGGRRRGGGRDCRRAAAEAYLAAREEGRDPVLAVMGATGRSRRRALRLIAAARDKGYLTPRHIKR
ncbi:DUF6214 family protein [Streptomyces litchfieldiae]|uniref:DUF6214 family protein n=1 Tax=Streptomyces litchfieldiae TaxID=3075543 RepID=A0ABU2N284_9ACTN|nr:DUF6214 family protein [Streptomyces sp. DSM 44938]MDT0347168.1 DUF6214 family protein [Streptomyces sp. DSM 44938]